MHVWRWRFALLISLTTVLIFRFCICTLQVTGPHEKHIEICTVCVSLLGFDLHHLL